MSGPFRIAKILQMPQHYKEDGKNELWNAEEYNIAQGKIDVLEIRTWLWIGLLLCQKGLRFETTYPGVARCELRSRTTLLHMYLRTALVPDN